MTTVNRWLEYLTKAGIRFSHSVHPRAETAIATADAERIPPYELAKPVVCACERGYTMAVVPGDEFVDLDELARAGGYSFLRLATETELAEIFHDCELGAMPPFGSLYGMPVFVDARMAGREFLAFNLGTHRDVARIGMKDYIDLVNPTILDISLREAMAI